MNSEELKQSLGPDYPTAMMERGIRMPLAVETRFARYYYASEPNSGGCMISRFMDGSASITSAELQREWATWTDEQRIDFCQASAWLHRQPDFPDMLRFIMQHGTSDDWSSIAQSIASQLPSNEAFPFLRDALRARSIGKCANLSQAIATTKHHEAEITLRDHLREVWRHPCIWNDDGFNNTVAFDATTCICGLIELGALPADFENQVRKLSQHVCPGIRDRCGNSLYSYYSWLQTPSPSTCPPR